MASTYLQRTPTTRTNNKKFTFSCWFKRSKITSPGYIAINYESGNDRGYVVIDSNDKFNVYDKAGGVDRLNILSNFVLRDTNAWYHLVYSVDSTAASNRVKFYINGVDRYNDFTVTTAMSQDSTVGFQQGTTSNGFKIGSQEAGSTTFNGLMSHINFVDGLQLDASTFGETDSTTGEWKILTSPTVSEYGNNGFFILKNSNSVTDQSGKGNNLTLGAGTLTNTLDCPSNVFATLNPLYNSGGTVTYANGNNNLAEADNQWKTTFSTLGASSGKYYAEFKAKGNYYMIGVADYNVTKSGTADYNFASSTVISEQGYGYYNGNGDLYYRGSSTSYGDTYGNGDIVQVALDCDNNRVFFGKNGTWQNSADPTTPSTGFAMTATNATYVFGVAVQNNNLADCNFGNGFFGTSAVADNSTATASTPGTFNYDVPTGYQPLSTKGLNA